MPRLWQKWIFLYLLSKEEYREKLNSRQKRIHELHNELYRFTHTNGYCIRGWDAAGKGGNIRRLTEEMIRELRGDSSCRSQ